MPDASQNDAGNNVEVDAGMPDTGPQCMPNCAGLSCGDDGCGGSCGTCAMTETCEAGACVAMPSACSMTGPFGTNEGQIIENATFQDCDGNTHELQDLCSTRAAWMFIYAGW